MSELKPCPLPRCMGTGQDAGVDARGPRVACLDCGLELWEDDWQSLPRSSAPPAEGNTPISDCACGHLWAQHSPGGGFCGMSYCECTEYHKHDSRPAPPAEVWVSLPGYGKSWFDDIRLDATEETIPGYRYKRRVSVRGALPRSSAPPAEVWVGVHSEHAYDNRPLTGFADEQSAMAWKEQSPHRIIERMTVHGTQLTTDPAPPAEAQHGDPAIVRTGREVQITGPGLLYDGEFIRTMVMDPDCAECEKPEQWEKLHERILYLENRVECSALGVELEKALSAYDSVLKKFRSLRNSMREVAGEMRDQLCATDCDGCVLGEWADRLDKEQG